ncbi:MAG: tRNA lysidine(34) synthetase TilS [Devosiaceae bacterium]
MLDRPSDTAATDAWLQVANGLVGFDGIVLAVSGGPDSLAMLVGLIALRNQSVPLPQIVAVTIDHGLRAEGAAEASHVADICADLGVAHQTIALDGKPAGNVQGWARQLRYDALAKVAHSQFSGRSFAMLTAHTADDQAETVLMRAARGAGSEGLAGIRAETKISDCRVLRPFLGWPKERLYQVLLHTPFSPVHDPTNEDASYTRVRYRKWLANAPMPDSARTLAEGMVETAAIAQMENEALNSYADQAFDKLDGAKHGYLSGQLALAELPLAVQARLLRRTLLHVARHPDARAKLDMGRMVALAKRIEREDKGSTAFAGARIEWSVASDIVSLFVYAEAGRTGFSAIDVMPGDCGLWDGRFSIANRSSEQLRVQGWTSKFATSRDLGLPKRVLSTLPVVLDTKGRVLGGPGWHSEAADIALLCRL